MKLYWGPHTCAIGIHILLEEAGATYETQEIDVSGGATQQPGFLAINPKGKVPILVDDDGSVLTEFGAIATWIARQYSQANLLPQNPDLQARVIEMLDYVVGTVHGQGFARIFLPERFEPQDAVHGRLGVGQSSVKAQGRKIVERGFEILDARLADSRFAVGSSFTIADAALFYIERWAPLEHIALPRNLREHYQTLLARPAVQKVRAIWHET